MKEHFSPRLRTVLKVTPPYQLNNFPKEFPIKLAKNIVYLLATRTTPSLEGQDWEEIFADCIGAKWKPSNVGLDDVILDNCAWGAKTVKAAKPSSQKNVRLISGRNSPIYSFGETKISDVDANHLGKLVLEIWNERVASIRQYYKFLRTIVLVKSKFLDELVLFEFDTVIYNIDNYDWQWNTRNNLQGFDKKTKKHKFTWQPHGSQFTIIEIIPDDSLIIRIRKPEKINKDVLLKNVGFSEDWVTVIKKNG